MVAGRDITDLKRAEGAAKASETVRLCEHDEAIFIADAGGRLTAFYGSRYTGHKSDSRRH